jgi:RimJ/RimL family protein N-acetyltransferase
MIEFYRNWSIIGYMTLPLDTARLILRAFADADTEPFARYRSDPEVARYQGWEAPYSLEQAASFVAEMKSTRPGIPGRWFQFAISRKDGGELIGDCGFVILLEDQRQAEIGFTLARAHQGQGYAGEAVLCMLDYLFRVFDLHRVRANCDPENHASARLLARLGLRHEGRFIESLWLKGRWCDEDWYAILRQEWKNR